MKSLFDECVILPLNIFKKCNYNAINSGDINKSKIMGEGNINMAQKILNSKNNQEDPMVIRQQELLNERMFGKNTYPTLTSFNSNEPKIKNNAKIPIEEILANIQLSERPYIRNILEKMIDNNILWTSLGEIIIKNQIVPNSNIIDIMRYFSKTIKVNSVKEIPPGSEKLYSLFKSMNIAESWIKVNPNKTKIKEEKLKQQQKEENTVMYYQKSNCT